MTIDYHELLMQKVETEYDEFLQKLKNMTAEQVIDRAYEKVIKEDMKAIILNETFSPKVAKALCREDYPLDRMYQDWLDTDVSHMEMLRDSIDSTARKSIKDMQREIR